MAGPSRRILLFLDIDGTLIPFGRPQRASAFTPLTAPDDSANPLLARLNPEHGQQLIALGCDLVWASSWAAEANEEISPRIGLPPLPVVDWPLDSEDQSTDAVHWKTRTLVAWAAGRPFVWVDDEIGEPDRLWVTRHHNGPALLHRIDPRAGLTDGDLAAIGQWLTQERASRRGSRPPEPTSASAQCTG